MEAADAVFYEIQMLMLRALFSVEKVIPPAKLQTQKLKNIHI